MALANLQGQSPVSFIAGGTITVGAAVYITAADTVSVTSAITQQVVGVALTSATVGLPVMVQTDGIAKCVASAAVSAGAELMPTGSGAGKCSTSSGATAVSFGLAKTAAGADGDVFEVILRPMLKSPANS